MKHQLKIWPEYLSAIRLGLKPYEIRKNDRNYQTGDILALNEWNPRTKKYSGDYITIIVKSVAHECIGVKRGYCVMTIEAGGE